MRTNISRKFSHKFALILIYGLLAVCLAALALNVSPLPAARRPRRGRTGCHRGRGRSA